MTFETWAEERVELHKVEGLITLGESDRLASLAMEVPSWASIVEIGSHTGRSSVWLACGARAGNGAHVTCIDPWPNPGYSTDPSANDDPFGLETGDAVLERFIDNVSSFQAWGNLTALRATSQAIAARWVNPIGLLFLDGLHDYAQVRMDCEAWLPNITVGGVLALHDFYEDEAHTRPSQVADGLNDVWMPAQWTALPMTDNLAVFVRR